jgi:hypothetical protein
VASADPRQARAEHILGLSRDALAAFMMLDELSALADEMVTPDELAGAHRTAVEAGLAWARALASAPVLPPGPTQLPVQPYRAGLPKPCDIDNPDTYPEGFRAA